MTDLDELDRLEKATTPGPWASKGYGDVCTQHPDHQNADNGSVWRDPSNSLGHCADGEYVDNINATSDAEMIVALRNAARSLISRARKADRLEEENARLREALADIASHDLVAIQGAGRIVAGKMKDRASAALNGDEHG